MLEQHMIGGIETMALYLLSAFNYLQEERKKFS